MIAKYYVLTSFCTKPNYRGIPFATEIRYLSELARISQNLFSDLGMKRYLTDRLTDSVTVLNDNIELCSLME